MRTLVDIIHPAHVHFFKHPIRRLSRDGHDVLVTSRDKDCTLALLDGFGIEHICVSAQNHGTVLSMARELVKRDRALARIAREFRPDVITGLGGICAAQVGRWLGIPSVVFYDTETAHLQNFLTYPLATRVVVPECYYGWTPKRKTTRYRGYHELAYLHPAYFTPDRDIALANGLAPAGSTFLVRVVAWKASHDLGLRGWSGPTLEAVVDFLAGHGKVVISAEGPLPANLEVHRFDGDSGQIHHLLAFCRLYAGESATMASEAVVLGVPGVYAGKAVLGYVVEQQRRYGLTEVSGARSTNEVLDAIERLLAMPADETDSRRRKLLDESIDVPAMVVETLLSESRP